jgi:hypothetical protein
MSASINKDAKVAETIGNTTASLLKDVDVTGAIGEAWKWVSDTSLVTEAKGWLGDLFD